MKNDKFDIVNYEFGRAELRDIYVEKDEKLNKHCKNCNKIANYNFINEKYGLYCKDHKLNDMVDVKNKKCTHVNCIKRPFNDHAFCFWNELIT